MMSGARPRWRLQGASTPGDAVRARDPFEVFDELMELVEGLLPGPLPRRPLGPTGRLLL
jgi:hypothetical protein